MDRYVFHVGRMILALLLCANCIFAGACSWLPRIDPSGDRIFLPPQSSAQPAAATAVPPGGFSPQPVQPQQPSTSVSAAAAPPNTFAPLSIAVAPTETTVAVGSQVTLIAAVASSASGPVAGQRVDWILAGPGQWVGTQSGPSWNPFASTSDTPTVQSANHAFGTTSAQARMVDRGTVGPADDFPLERGQTWITLGSHVEGTSQITGHVQGPGVAAPASASAVIHWIDAQWIFAPSAQAAVGGRHALTTVVTRRTTGTPLAGWRVRYQVQDGVPASFPTSGSQVAEVPTDGVGRATVELQASETRAGATQVLMQLLRPPPAGQSDQRLLVVGSAIAAITWSEAAGSTPPAAPVPALPAPAAAPPAAGSSLEVTIRGPNQAAVGENVRFQIEIANRGAAAVSGLVITDRFDDGFEHLVAKSPIERAIEDIAPATTATFPLTFRVAKPGRHCHRVEVQGAGGTRATAEACLEAVASSAPLGEALLEVVKTAPRQARLGEAVLFELQLRNTGTLPLNHLRVADSYEQSLTPTDASEGFVLGREELIWDIPRLDPGQTRTLKVRCQCVRATPRACSHVVVTCDERPPTPGEACVEILPAEDPPASAAQSAPKPSAATAPQAAESAPAGASPDLPPPSQPGAAQTPPAVAAPPATAPLLGPANDGPTGSSGAESAAGSADAAAPDRLQVTIVDLSDPVRSGDRVVYQVQVKNSGSKEAVAVTLTLAYPADLTPARIGTRGPSSHEIVGQSVRFAPLGRLLPGESVSFVVPFLTTRPGSIEVQASTRSAGLPSPIESRESTRVLPP